MKLTAPKNAEQYFQQTEHAVRHAYSGLDSCWAFYQEACRYLAPPIVKDGMRWYLPPVTPEEQANLARYLELAGKYFDLKISEATFAGSISQVAYMAIQLYSPHRPVSASCASLSLPNSAGRFCIGKQRHGVPTGLIVYAGRNQYAHWDDEAPHEHTKAIFAMLDDSFEDNPFSDLAFDLGNPSINIYAGEVLLTALGWNSYDAYLTEMEQLLP
jgi:hypothetical protein